MHDWYRKSVSSVFADLTTGKNGLDQDEASERLERYGHNELKFKRRSALLRFLAQFNDPMVYVLLIAALVTAFLSEWVDMAVITLVVVLNVLIGFIQEGKAESSIEALQKMMVPKCTVIREGQKQTVEARLLVPGDIVVLESGNRIPADMRIFQAKSLRADESLLTGESTPVNKDVEDIEKENVLLADQDCMLFSGTFVTTGTGQGVVVATGRQTELGKIADLVKETPKVVTPLTKKINEFTRILMIAIAIIAVINFFIAVWFKYSMVYAFLASVSLAVAAIPEMLPAIIVAILALASVVMARRNALIRKLPAAETLGSTTVICSDKTGTLTKNEMTVKKIFCGKKTYSVTGAGYEIKGEFIFDGIKTSIQREPMELKETLIAGYVCNDASFSKNDGTVRVIGDPTEAALSVSAMKAGVTERPKRIDEIPFESVQQYMATLHEVDGRKVVYVKGAPERVLGMCKYQAANGNLISLKRDEIMARAGEMAQEALRVLAMAYKRLPDDKKEVVPGDLADLTFLGLQGMMDPPRKEVIEAVVECKKAGIRVIMMTGDHAQTAKAIAREIGIIGENGRVLAGEELSGMSDRELYASVQYVSVFARIAPKDKLRITQQLQKRGNIVAVTGDGVNDAPALKAADIGVAMGITGTEVSKEAADMVLADDNFATIVAAVEEGRHAWNNFRKAVLYTLPTNGGQALLVMGGILVAPFLPVFAQRLPLEPIQILWINLADSVFLTMPLMMEPKEKNLLNAPPRSRGERIIDRLFLLRVGVVSLIMAATGFVLYNYFGAILPGSVSTNGLRLAQAQTAAFIGVQFLHIGYLFTARRIRESAFTFSPFSNKWLLAGVGLTVITALLMVYSPFFNMLFRTAPFPTAWWGIVLLALFPGFIAIEVEKFFKFGGAK